MQKNRIAKFLFLPVLAVLGLILFGAKDFSFADSTSTATSTSPTVSVSVYPTSVYTGGSVEVGVSAVPGTVSLINSVSVKLASPTGANFISLESFTKDSQGIWRGQAAIPSGVELGVWKVYRVQTTDTAGNIKAYYYNNDINVTFSVAAPSCDFVYSDWSDCQNGVQIRTVSSTSPFGCSGGTPFLSQTCSVVPPVCTVKYSDWGTCADGQQSRTIVSKEPDGCVIDSLTSVLTRSCTVCSYWHYSDWSTCENSQQSRTVLYSYPASCTGGQPGPLTRSCTVCSEWKYSDWSACADGKQSRTVSSSYPTGCIGGQPGPLVQSCQNSSSSTCQSDEWSCQGWGTCASGIQRRVCSIVSDCPNITNATPQIERSCTVSSTSTPTSTVFCQYKYSDWSACENGKQRRTIAGKTPAGCSEGSAEPLEKYCTACAYTYGDWSGCLNGKKTRSVISTYPADCFPGKAITEEECESLPVCTLDDWKCEDWSVCSSGGKQSRKCSLGSNCVSVSAVKPTIEKICTPLQSTIEKPPAVSAGSGAQSSTAPIANNTGKTQDQSCIRAGLQDQKDCQWYLYQSKITKECLEKGLKDQNKCREYFLGKYGKPLKCQGMNDEKCNALINEIILSDLKNLIVPEAKQNLADLSGSAAIVNGENKTLTVNIGNKDGGTSVSREVKVENLPLSRSGGNIAVTLLPVDAAGQQDILSPIALGFDVNGNGIPDDAEGRLGSLAQDRGSVTKEQLASLSGVDQALIQGKPLEQPKLSNASSSKSLTVVSIKNATSATSNNTAGALKFQGKAEPGQVVTLFIYSSMPIVLTVKADENGNWVYDLDKSLVDGTHEIYAVISDKDGRIVETSQPAPFFIQEAKAVTVDDFVKTQPASAVPDQSANITTFYLIGGGALILIMVVGFLLFRKKATE